MSKVQITKDLLPTVLGKFYFASITIEQFINTPSLDGIDLYEEYETIPTRDYIVLYARDKLLLKNLEYDEEKECYNTSGVLEPDFYLRTREVEI